MLKLTYAKYGSTGVLRRYQHSKFGLIQTVTTWREPGAQIIRIETERDREKWRSMIERLRHQPAVSNGRSQSTVKKVCNGR